MENQELLKNSMEEPSADCQSGGCSCGKTQKVQEEKYVYAIGKLSVRLPSIGLEREFQQRQRALFSDTKNKASRDGNVAQVLSDNLHIAKFSCFILTVDGIPAYIVRPTGSLILENLIKALDHEPKEQKWVAIVGKRGSMANPATTNGVVAPEMFCDIVYVFDVEQLMENLIKQVKPILENRKWDTTEFFKIGSRLFYSIVGSPDNLGSMDGQRALNYLAIQHPGPYLAAMEYDEKARLESIDTRLMEGPAGQKIVTVILKFVDRLTGMASQVCTRVDVTEEWPFSVGTNLIDEAPLMMMNFIDATYS